MWSVSVTWIFLGYALYAEGIWKGDIVVADIEDLEQRTRQKFLLGDLVQKEVTTRKKGIIFFIPDRRWNIRIAWRRSGYTTGIH